jgi:TonB family protein
MILYLIKFIACSAILMLLFHFLLAKEKTFCLNRWVLLLLIPVSMLIPLIHIPILLPQESQVQISYLELVSNEPQEEISITPSSQAPSHHYWFPGLYLVVFFLLLISKLYALRRLIHWRNSEHARAIKGAFLILSEKALSPFSFGKYIFMHPNAYKEGSEATHMILKHERVHIAQRHYIDLAVMEFMTLICWFNPVAFMARRAMTLNHEYLADQGVQGNVHPVKYKKLLLKLSVRHSPTIWASAISSSTLKLRLIMINKSSNKSIKMIRTACFGLSALLIITGFSITTIDQQPDVLPPTSRREQQWNKYQGTPDTKLPEFKGGMPAFYSYIESQLKYPLYARQNDIEGKVIVQFIIEKDGAISNVSTISGIGAGCDLEAESVLKNTPAFNPAMQRGRPVRVKMVLPIEFFLSHNTAASDQLRAGIFKVGEMELFRNEALKVDANYANGKWAGSIKDPEDNFLPGATIEIEGTSTGTVTDINGKFSIKSKSTDVLLINFAGYKTVKFQLK